MTKMTPERECTDGMERGSASTTSEFAAQCWDQSNWKGNNSRPDESNLTTIDLGDYDIYNPRGGNRDIRQGNRDLNDGNRDLHDGNRGLQNAEDKINKVVDQLLDGNYDTNKLVKQLQRSDKSLDGAGGDYKDAIKKLGATSTTENLDDLVDGRRDVLDADKKVEKAIRQLQAGDENGAIKSLLQSLGKIDSAQDEFRDAKTDKDGRYPRRGMMRDRDDDDRRGGKENTDDFRPGNRTSRRDDDGRVHDHMYRDRDLMYTGGTPDFDESGGHYRDDYDHGRTDTGMWDSNGQDTVLNVRNPLGENDQIIWHSGDLTPSRIRLSNPIGGGGTTIDLDQLTRTGDQIASVVDPAHILPNASDMRDPVKLFKKIHDPLGIFG